MQSSLLKKSIIKVLLLLTIPVTINSQDLFTGRITYEIGYRGSNIDLATMEQLPREANLTVKREMVRTEMEVDDFTQIKIADSDNRTVSTILEILRQRYVIHKSPADIEETLRDMIEPEITITDETKEILGFTCKKAEAVYQDHFGEKITSYIYFTEEISGEPFNFDLPYNEIPGLMLQYEIKIGDINMQYEATSIRSRWGLFISNRNFRIPRDAKEVTYEELREKLQ